MKSLTHHPMKSGWTATILGPCLAALLSIAPLGTAFGQAAPDAPKPQPPPTNTPAPQAEKPAPPPAAAPTPAPAPAPAPAPEPAKGEEIQLSFQGANIDIVAQWLAQITGKSVVKSPRVQCQLNIMSSKKLTVREAVNTVYRALSLEGFSVTETATTILIGAEGQEPKLTPELIGSTNNVPEGKQRLVKVFALQHTLATEMREKIKGVLSDKASIDADDPSSRIIITDYNENLTQAKNMIEALDTENPAEVSVHIIQLKNVSAPELAREIAPMAQRGRGAREIVAILSNDQGNSLIVISTEPGFKKVEKIVTTLDSKVPVDLAVRILPIKHLNVYQLVRIASPIYQRFAARGETLDISINDQSNSLIILSSEANYKEVEKVVETLDTGEASDIAVRIIPVKQIDAPTLAAQVAPLCRRIGGKNSAIDIMPDYQGNSLIVLSCQADYETILKVVTALDSNDRGDLALRTIAIKNVNAYTLIRMAAPFYTRLAGRGKKEVVEVTVNEQNNSLIVFSSEANFHEVEKIVQPLDTEEPGGMAVRVIPIKHSDAPTLANQIAPLCRRIGGKGLNNTIDIMADYQSNSLIVLSCEKDYQSVLKIVGELDTEDRGDLALRTIPLKNVNGYTLVRMAAPFYTRLAGRAKKDAVEVTVNDQNNSLIVFSSESNFHEVEKIVQTLDTEEPGGISVRVISIKHSDAATMAAQIAPLCRRIGGKGQNNAVDLVADAQSNSLIVLSTEMDYQMIVKIVGQLDTEDHGDLSIRSLPLKHINANTLIRMAAPFYTRLAGRGNKDVIEVSVNDQNNSLVVFSNEKNFKSVEKIVSELDTEEPGGIAVRVINLKHIDAATLAIEIAPLCRRVGGKGQNNSIDIVADGQSNALIILSCESDYTAVQKIVTALDTDDRGDMKIRIITLKHVGAATLAREVGPLCARMSGKGQNNQIEITANDVSNTLIVLSTEANFKAIEKIVETLDTDNRDDITVHVITLNHVNAVALAREVTPLCQRMSGRGQKDFIDVVANEQSNSLVVMASDSNYQAIENIVTALDTEKPEDVAIRAIPLKFVNAQDLSREVAPLCQRMSGRGQKDVIEVTANDKSNALMVLSSEYNFHLIEKIVAGLDVDNRGDVAVRVITLKHMNAQDLAREMGPLYQRLTGKELSAKGQKDVIEVTANDRSNSLIVLSSAENFKAIEKLIVGLDTTEAQEKAMHVFTLVNADAQDVARQLETLFSDNEVTSSRYSYFGYGGRGNDSKKKMSVVADRRRNSLIVQVPPIYMESISNMVQTLDEPIKDDSLAPKIYPLKYVSAGDIEDILNELFLKKSTQRSYWNPFTDENDTTVTDRDVGRLYGKVRITSEPHANAIIVTANSSENLSAVESVLRQLDQPSEAGESTLRVPLNYAKAANVANSVNILFARGGAPSFRPTVTPQQQTTQNNNNNNNNSTSPQNNFELELDAKEDGYYPWLGGQQEASYSRNGDRNGSRPVSDLIGRVRAVPDHRSNALLISANMHYFPQIMKLINEMDAPNAQVLIDAKLVEVSTDYLDKLGVRWGPTGSTAFTSDDYDNGAVITSKNALTEALHSGTLSQTANMDLLIQFMRKTGDAAVLAEPKINIADNEMGRLFVGSQVPFIDKSQSTDTGGLNQSFSYKNVGVILEVTPHINKQGDIALRIRAESSAIETGQTLFGGAIVDTRNFRTDLTAKDGQTLVLGGIIQKQVSNITRKVPILGDIPGLGYLFKKKDTVSKNVELMVFLRPSIVRTAEEAQTLMDNAMEANPLIQKWQNKTKKDDETRKALDAKEAELEKAKDAEQAAKEKAKADKAAKKAKKAAPVQPAPTILADPVPATNAPAQ